MTPNQPDLPGSVLFACTRNSIRSPIAAGLMRHYFGHKVKIASVGVHEAAAVDGFALACVAELGIDISSHRPQIFASLDGEHFDLIVSLSPEAHHPAIELTRDGAVQAEYWPTLDPSLATGNREQILAAFREVREALKTRILERFGRPSAPEV